MTRVLIIADIRLYRDGLAQVLAQENGIEVAGAVADAFAAEKCLAAGGADVVLLDMALTGSARAVRRLRTIHPAVRVVALGVPDDEAHVLACAEAGVSGYVPREGSLGDLVEAVHSTARGEMVCSPRMAGSLIRHVAVLAARGAPAEPRAQLTSREAEIVGLIDEGLSNKEIASRLSIELPTVKNHVHNILEKLHVRRRSEAAARFRRWRADLDPAALGD